jgi:hypothetical protein
MLGCSAQARNRGDPRVPVWPVRPRYPGSVPRRGAPMILTPSRQTPRRSFSPQFKAEAAPLGQDRHPDPEPARRHPDLSFERGRRGKGSTSPGVTSSSVARGPGTNGTNRPVTAPSSHGTTLSLTARDRPLDHAKPSLGPFAVESGEARMDRSGTRCCGRRYEVGPLSGCRAAEAGPTVAMQASISYEQLLDN